MASHQTSPQHTAQSSAQPIRPKITPPHAWAGLPDAETPLTAEAVIQLQRTVGNRAVTQWLAQRQPAVIQRAVSPSATWPPQASSQEETWITQLDAQIPTAEQTAVNSVQNNGVTAKEQNYIRNPSPTTWGYVVEEKLDVWAQNNGWQTQHRLTGARPDYYRTNNSITLYVDLTTAGQAGIGGNHITGKLQNAGIKANSNIYAADITHQGLNPRGHVGPVVVLGNATLKEMRIFQKYRRYLRAGEDSYDPALEALVKKYGKVSQVVFQKWNKTKRAAFVQCYLRVRNKGKSRGITKQGKTRKVRKGL